VQAKANLRQSRPNYGSCSILALPKLLRKPDWFPSSLLVSSFDVADEIANNLDPIGIVVRNLHACERIFDQYHQFEAIVMVHAEFVSEVRFIRN